MGRLFWKFFFATLLAQLMAMLSIGGTLWLNDPQREAMRPAHNAGAQAVFMIEAAAATLQHSGPGTLREMLDNAKGRIPLYVIDESGRELLAREVDATLVVQARRQLVLPHTAVKQVHANDGHDYLLFQPRGLEPEHRPHPPPGLPPPPHHREQWGSLIPFVTALLASLLFAALFAWYFSKPIRQLRAAIAAAGSGDLHTDLRATMGRRRDELADLGGEFDRMAHQLRMLMDGQRRLLHDVSHELRSPLARMQAAIGLMRQSPEKMEASLARIEHECVHMDKLIGELLDLSRLESGIAGMPGETINVGALIADIVESAGFEAQCCGKEVCYLGKVTATIEGQVELLHRALENVVRNAVKYTAVGTRVTIEARTDDRTRELLLSVADAGPGVAEAELEQIFTPFFRGSSTRQHTAGHGLGLAIAKRVVEAHGGQLRAFNRAEGGLCVELRLPLSVTDKLHKAPLREQYANHLMQ